MKLKSSAIAVAVAGALGASMAVQAESGFYGSVRVGLQYLDTAGESNTTVRGYASRFGFRGETDMGNGLTGFGRYEFGVATEGTGPNVTRRHAYVGMKGDWGSVILGQTYHTYYNFISGPLDNPWWGSGDAMLAYTGRTAQAITYAGSFGMVAVGATAYLDSSSTDASDKQEDLDGYELAASIQAGPIKLGLGIQDRGNDQGAGDPDSEPTVGLTASGWETGMFTWGLGYAQQDNEGVGATGTANSIVFDVQIANGYVHYEMLDMDTGGGPGDSPTALTLGYTQSVGRQTTMWYEVEAYDADTTVSDDDATIVRAVLKYDWK